MAFRVFRRLRDLLDVDTSGVADDDVLTYEAGTQRWVAAAGGGGGSTPGASRVLGPFPFAFDDVGLNDGIEFYTPTVGDVILALWVEIVVAWDGTTPACGVGTLVEGSDPDPNQWKYGQWPIPVAPASGQATGDGLTQMFPVWISQGSLWNVAEALPLKVFVSQDGAGDPAPGATQGSSRIYLLVATPSLT
jgi:hypothetical protein